MDDLREDVEHVLAESTGANVQLAPDGQVLRTTDDGYATVGRFRIRGPSDLPPAVVVKRPANWAPFDPSSAEGPAWGFFNEWAALEFLDGADLAPRLLAGDREKGLLVLEDLGDGDGLADALLGNDAAEAEAQLMAFADALARLHCFSAPRLAEYENLRRRLGPTRSAGDQDESGRLIRRLAEACKLIGVDLTSPIQDEVRAAFGLMETANLRVLCHGDACPDNTRLVDGSMRFIDFWVGRVRHALLDGSYARSPFPTCWCVRRLPPDVVIAMETRYREIVVSALPALADDATFGVHLVAALGLWLVEVLAWHIPHAMDDDEPLHRGIHTRRQGALLRLENFQTAAENAEGFGLLAEFAGAVEARLRLLWPDVADTPLYPAFER